ncbi:hypothetical protein AAFF_G00282900 [Aldrovandia affinis]|uniref:Rhodanese domain-containing protein n=1 Tax=Aldrovandia affinis TaxID=143900 RepID=A0AAD7TB39_9TELE|nr:hypothetical protein AAFF_G00282900 [Aldrovandia affinis]
MAGEKSRRSVMDTKRLAGLLQRGAARTLVIDSRTFSEYNASHVLSSVNVCCSKLVKRRLQQDKVSVTELLQPNSKVKVDLGRKQEVVVYDQSTKDASTLSKDSFIYILLGKLEGSFHRVSLLTALSGTRARRTPGGARQVTLEHPVQEEALGHAPRASASSQSLGLLDRRTPLRFVLGHGAM